MRQRLMRIIFYVLISIPLVYFVSLSTYAFIRYRSYYENNLFEIPFDFYSFLVVTALSFVSLLAIYKITVQERQTHTQNHKNLLAEFLVTQNFGNIFRSDLFRDLQKEGQIEKVTELTGGYSGARVYSFYRKENLVPDILKVAEVEEIENEYHKFVEHVDGQLLIGPNVCRKYLWGSYAGLEYNLKWNHFDCDHLTFLDLYQEFLDQDTNIQPGIDTIEEIVKRLFQELKRSWKWTDLDLKNVNIYAEYYPFTEKFAEIDPQVESHFAWGQTNLGLNMAMWGKQRQALDTLLSIREWNRRKQDNQYSIHIARATIHGDLNSRNILLEANSTNHDEIYTIGLVDFSHTGNGLTTKRTEKAIRAGISLDRNRGHIINDFCRLEADIKFYLTDLNDEQELRQAWILENLLLKYGLELPPWDELLPTLSDEVRGILEGRGLLTETEWAELTAPGCWQENNAKKFILAWQSIRAIRDSLRPILQKPHSMEPFYLALCQASLSVIYYEGERFHNADLQKLYIVLASTLLVEKLL